MQMTPVAILAVLIWVPVVLWLFARRDAATALAVSVLGGYLLLPQSFAVDLPAVPTLDKNSVTALAAALGAALIRRPSPGGAAGLDPAGGGWALAGLWPQSRLVRLLLLLLVVGVVGTVLTNGTPLHFGPKTLPAMRPYDIAALMGNTLFALIPFLLARKYIAHPAAQRRLLVILALAGVLYALPALYEVRMSPQLSRMVYGYFPHDWRQHIRAGGYRPVVFLHHGLWLAILFCASFLAALSLRRQAAGAMRLRWGVAALWLLATLVLAKGVGALAIGLALAVPLILLPARSQMLVVAAVAGTVIVYPMLRGAGLIPTTEIGRIATAYNQERGDSLAFRLHHEDALLDRASQQPVFGWGGWGRNRIYDDQGRDQSVTDGYWVMAIGTGGWVGYVAQMGLLCLPALGLALRWRRRAATAATAGIGVALAANLIDLIPNATLTPVTWLLAGALAGTLELVRAPHEPVEPAPSPAPSPAAAARPARPGATGPEADRGIPPRRAAGGLRPVPPRLAAASAIPPDPGTAGARSSTAAPNPYTRQTRRHPAHRPESERPEQDGPVQDGPEQDGPVQDGPVQDGPPPGRPIR